MELINSSTVDIDVYDTIDYKLNDHPIAIRTDIHKRIPTQQTNVLRITLCIIIIIIYLHNGNSFNQISYMCIIWIITSTSNIICAYKLNETRIVCHRLNKTIITTFMIYINGCEKFDANMNTINHIYQILQEVNNFNFIITTINVSEPILYQMKKLLGEAYLFIVTLIFKFSTHSNTADLFLLYLAMNNIDNLNLIVCIFNTIITIIVDIAGIYTFLIVAANQ